MDTLKEIYERWLYETPADEFLAHLNRMPATRTSGGLQPTGLRLTRPQGQPNPAWNTTTTQGPGTTAGNP